MNVNRKWKLVQEKSRRFATPPLEADELASDVALTLMEKGLFEENWGAELDVSCRESVFCAWLKFSFLNARRKARRALAKSPLTAAPIDIAPEVHVSHDLLDRQSKIDAFLKSLTTEDMEVLGRDESSRLTDAQRARRCRLVKKVKDLLLLIILAATLAAGLASYPNSKNMVGNGNPDAVNAVASQTCSGSTKGGGSGVMLASQTCRRHHPHSSEA